MDMTNAKDTMDELTYSYVDSFWSNANAPPPSKRPIFLATHPRSCSTAFERVFMTQKDTIHCIHEPFGDAFYFGPERLGARFDGPSHAAARIESGYEDSTYKVILDSLEAAHQSNPGKRLFIKDMAQCLIPTPSFTHWHGFKGSEHVVAPSVGNIAGVGVMVPHNRPSKIENPTVLPNFILKKFQWTFLIRHPARAVPSYYRCTIPPLSEKTGFHGFRADEMGYRELRMLLEYFLCCGIVKREQVTLLDAEDLLDEPSKIVQEFCKRTGLKYEPEMMHWSDEEGNSEARKAFTKWNGFHEDALKSGGLFGRKENGRVGGKRGVGTVEVDREWREKYGEEGAKIIRKTVDECLPDYEFLRGFRMVI